MSVEPVAHGLRVTAFEGAVPFYLLCPELSLPQQEDQGFVECRRPEPVKGVSSGAEVVPEHLWYTDYFLAVEDYRGLDARDDNLYAGHFRATLQPGESLTLVASTEAAPDLNGTASNNRRRTYEQQLLEQSDVLSAPKEGRAHAPRWVQQLILAADQFIVRRSLPEDPDGRTVIAGYPWFGDWGRDTMISLPGLTLVTGRYDVAERILRTFARFVDQGMLPNRFPEEGERPEYNTVDATLWYVEATRAYHAATNDNDLLRDLFPVLQEIFDWHERGTRYNIHVDLDDGLLYAGEPGLQLTWMDAKVGDWVVTPRIGKPVEVNALWYNALCSMADFARHMNEPADGYEAMADQTREGFARFWNEEAGYCFDVLDGPEGDDSTLRPNQLFAVSLPHSPLDADQQRGVVDACARQLVTSHGVRSLSPSNPAYIGHYGGGQRQRDAAYHQGTVWGWLIGPFATAHLRVYGDPGSTRSPEQTRSFLEPFINHLSDHGVGSISEIFDGDPPHTPRGCVAQAWSVAEVLRVWQTTKNRDGGKESVAENVGGNRG
jgi:predicted glycogen debranching enzyme